MESRSFMWQKVWNILSQIFTFYIQNINSNKVLWLLGIFPKIVLLSLFNRYPLIISDYRNLVLTQFQWQHLKNFLWWGIEGTKRPIWGGKIFFKMLKMAYFCHFFFLMRWGGQMGEGPPHAPPPCPVYKKQNHLEVLHKLLHYMHEAIFTNKNHHIS